MKKRNLNITGKLFLAAIFVLFAGMTFGQGRSSARRVESGNSRSSGTSVITRRDGRGDRDIVVRDNNSNSSSRVSYRDNNTNNNSSNSYSRYNYRADNNNNNKGNGNSGNYGNGNNGNHGNWNNGNHGNGNNGNHYGHDKWSNGYNYNWNHGNHYYHHTYNSWNFPAPWSYSHNAWVFRHDHGDFYYHHGSFYRYHPNRGYYIVDYPSSLVFSFMPIGYTEVMINGVVYLRYGDLYFEYTPWGYRVVPVQSGIYFSVNF